MSGKTTNTQQLTKSNVPISDMALAIATHYSDSIDVRKNTGFMTLFASVDAAGDVDLWMEYSYDNVTFARAKLSDLAGSAPNEGDIVTTLTNVSGVPLIFPARLAPYARVAIKADAISTVSLKLVYQEEF